MWSVPSMISYSPLTSLKSRGREGMEGREEDYVGLVSVLWEAMLS